MLHSSCKYHYSSTILDFTKVYTMQVLVYYVIFINKVMYNYLGPSLL